MPKIYFEKQVAAMCGQHLLNNLLQGNHFDAESLSNIALSLDQNERELGLAVDATRFNGSQNVDASGNFSIQVLEMALEQFQVKLTRDEQILGKTLTMINDASVPDSRINEVGFAFNSNNHWFCARWLHNEFWVMNSMEQQPEPIKRMKLGLFIQQMRADKWSVFVTVGKLPPMEIYDESSPNWFLYGADAQDKDKKPKIAAFQGKGYSMKAGQQQTADDLMAIAEQDPELAQALRMSMVEFDAGSSSGNSSDNAVVLQAEPPSGAADCVMVQLILPAQGKKVRRRFQSSLQIGQIYAWAKTFPEVASGALQTIQRVEDRVELKRDGLIGELGPACSLRVIMI